MKRLSVLILFALALAMFVACAPAPTAAPTVAPPTAAAPAAATKAPAPAATTAPAAGKVPVGIVLPTKDEPRWIQDQTRFQDALKAAGYDVQILFSQGDSAKEKANVESLISQGVKVIILTPQDGKAAAAAADEARAAGVKVIAYDRAILDTASVDYYVTFDSVAVGKAQGQYLIDQAGATKGNNLYLYAGAASDNNAFVFFQGAWSVLQPKIADGTFVIKNSSEAVAVQATANLTRDQQAKIIGQITTNWDFNTAKGLAEANLTKAAAADKGTVFILAPNDGTARAIADTFAADKAVTKFYVTGQDAEKASVQYIIDGKQSMTVFKDVRTLVNDAIAAAVAFLKGQTPPSTAPQNNGKIDVPAKPSAVVTVTKANVKAALIDSGYYQASDFKNLDAAAAAPTVAPTAAAAPVTLTFYYPVAVAGPITQVIDGYIQKFQAANPNIKVNAVLSGGYPDTLTKIQTTIKGGGTPPDVAVLLSTDLYSLVDADAVMSLDDLVKAAGGDTFTSDFYPAYLANSSYQGHIWSLPFQRSIPVLYYNKDLFKAAGLDPNKPPTNYQEMVDAAKKLTKADGSQWGIEISSDGIPYWLFQSFVIGNGTNVIGKAANKVTFNDPAVVAALQDFADLGSKSKVMPADILLWANMPNDFVNGKAAMIWHSSGSLTNILKQAKFDVGVSYTVGEKGFGAATGGGNIYMLKGIPADRQAAAWKFMQFMTSTDIQADWSIQTGYVPGRQSAMTSQAMKDYIAKTPQAAVAPAGLKYAGAELAAHNNAQIQKALGDAVQAALTGKSSAADALKAAQTQADQILASFKD